MPVLNLSRRLVLGVALLTGAMAVVASAQVRGTRFEITQASDTTLTFAIGDALWVRSGLRGIAVDPTQHDALIAEFHILRVRSGIATAQVTGVTTQPDTDDIAILNEPTRSFFRTIEFWGGVAAGFALGLLVWHH